jgi:L-rhamnose isomerase
MKENDNGLGMNTGTASHRLRQDLLFYFVNKEGAVCHHCKMPMERDNFSIEHIKPWRKEKNALELFFDLNNITFSHLKCNVDNRRVPEKFTDEEIRLRRNRRNVEYRARTYCPIKRKERYLEKGY